MATQHVTWLNHRETGPEIIPIDPKSETVPDMTLSLQDLLERHTQGREVPIFEGYFDDEALDEFYPDLARLDMVEIQELIETNMDHVSQIQAKLHKQQSDDFKSQMDTYYQQKEKESSQSFSDPKQQGDAGAAKPAEGGKPHPSAGQQH